MTGSTLIAGGARSSLSKGRLVLVSVGKAASTMAASAERILGSRLDQGLVVDTAETARLRRSIRRVASHPLPNERGLRAARELEEIASGLGAEDTLLFLVSGGASALLPAPVEGVTLDEKIAVTRQLLRAGATIYELNTVRKHLSRLKGGGLARIASPARVLSLVLSDVADDDLATIASGPTSPDPTTYAQSLAILDRRGGRSAYPASVRRHLEAGERGAHPETPKPGDRLFRAVSSHVIGSNRTLVEAAANEARRRGFHPLILTTRLQGEAREAALVLVSILREALQSTRLVRSPFCLLAGGETTVTVRGTGRGGRNQELALAAALALSDFTQPAVVASLASDGVDGMSDKAGAIVGTSTAKRARERGLSLEKALAANDSSTCLTELGEALHTGPTGTNVLDLTMLLAGTRK